MRYLFIGILFLLGPSLKISAQIDSLKYNHLFYAGFQGGYLLKNNSLNKNGLYRFSNGMYAELNAGWRHKQWGWELALGYLTIKRDRDRINKYQVSANDVLNTQASNSIYDNARDSGQIGDAVFTFPTSRLKYNQDLKGWYALTGPTYWLSYKKIQFQFNVKGGILLRKFGYYLITGNGISPDSITISYNAAGTAATKPTLGKATVTPNGTFANYGMSQSLWESVRAQNNLAQAGINEKSAIQFAGRIGAQAEYFINERISINAAAQYWFIPSPPMTGLDTLRGIVRVTRRTYAQPNSPIPTNYGLILKNNYTDKNNLGFLSAAIGLKVWLGSNKSKVDNRPETTITNEIAPKNLSIIVVNKTDNTPLKDVTIKVYKDGDNDYIETITNEEGHAFLIRPLTPGNYTVIGTKEGSSTNEVKITTDHFKSIDKAINIKLTL